MINTPYLIKIPAKNITTSANSYSSKSQSFTEETNVKFKTFTSEKVVEIVNLNYQDLAGISHQLAENVNLSVNSFKPELFTPSVNFSLNNSVYLTEQISRNVNLNIQSFLPEKLTLSVNIPVNNLEYSRSELTDHLNIPVNSFIPNKSTPSVHLLVDSFNYLTKQTPDLINVSVNELTTQTNILGIKQTELGLKNYPIISNFAVINTLINSEKVTAQSYFSWFDTNINSVKSDLVINQELVSIPINLKPISKIN